jgi:dipeptidyl aminopeptidase/acylaminoacyl peptidase
MQLGVGMTDRGVVSDRSTTAFARRASPRRGCFRLVYVLGLAALATGAAGATTASPAGKAPSIVQSLGMRVVSAPKISPDGRRVIFEQSRTNWETNAFETDLFIADVGAPGGGGAPRLLTNGVRSSTSGAWSPDGRWIAFLSDRPGQLAGTPADTNQIYVMAADGGEARQLTKVDKGVKDLDWTPDSRSLVFTAEAPEPEAMKDRKDTFGDYHVIHADYAMVRLWRIGLPLTDASGGVTAPAAPKPLTKGEAFSVGAFAVSPDGTQVAFDAQRDPDLISAFSSDIYVLTLAGGGVKRIVDTPGPDISPKWSPDGTRIAYETAAGSKAFFYTNHQIAIVDAAGGAPRVLTGGFDEDAAPIRWTPSGIYFSALQKTEAGLFRLDPGTGAIDPVVLPGARLASRFSLSAPGSGERVAFVGAGANQYAEIYTADLAAPAPVRITRAGDQIAAFDTARREVVSWTSADGTPIEGILYKPSNFDARKTYPLLVVIHGGPTGVDTPVVNPDRYYPVERFVAKGALVLRPNYRGSAGYGEKFRSLNVRNLGVGDYADVISGVNALIARGFVDRNRVGAMGWSEGGYISAFITASSDRFKAVSVGAGISDWMTYYANTDITPFTRQYLGATPWDDPAIYRKTSPIDYIAQARTPTLIQHGGADRRVPLADSYELRQALEDHGVPVKMVVYDGFGHPINKPKQQRAVMEENESWFGHYIWGDALAPSLTPDPAHPKPAP